MKTSAGPAEPPRVCGYFEEEAVISYTHYLTEIDERPHAQRTGSGNRQALWKLPPDATLRDVVLVVRADEAHHRDVNHAFASELGGAHAAAAFAPYPDHASDIRTAAGASGRRRRTSASLLRLEHR